MDKVCDKCCGIDMNKNLSLSDLEKETGRNYVRNYLRWLTGSEKVDAKWTLWRHIFLLENAVCKC